MMLITSINVLGRIKDKISPTATQNRANPITRFISHAPVPLLDILCQDRLFYAAALPFGVKNIRHLLLRHLIIVTLSELIHHIRHHIEDLGDRILILDVHQPRLSVLDD